MSKLAITPIHYASVSGGKDSLYMMKIILENPKKYPLDMAVHFELEIDHDFVKDSVAAIEKMCNSISVPFKRIKPRKKWEELYEKYGFPRRTARWCNNMYKLDCDKQIKEWITSQKCRPVSYIGFCADEKKRFKYQVGAWNPEEFQDVCYPLAEEGIDEVEVLKWARKQTAIFGDWYKFFARQGCWLCPMASCREIAYLYLNDRKKFDLFIKYARESEERFGMYFHKPIDELIETIKTKYVPILIDEGKDLNFLEELEEAKE